ncbi:unnamed protein product [marine sediment metagenome]|uniref:Uncharacterized protein n=1 Tax=marine sediment metagenome TaxID=412755 RepID=X1KPQ4_9ZZZZ
MVKGIKAVILNVRLTEDENTIFFRTCEWLDTTPSDVLRAHVQDFIKEFAATPTGVYIDGKKIELPVREQELETGEIILTWDNGRKSKISPEQLRRVLRKSFAEQGV